MHHPIPVVFGSRVVFGDGRSNGTISGWIKFKVDAGGYFEKVQTVISLKRITRFTLHMYTDHALPSDSTMTVDTYDRSLDTYFTREVLTYGIK